MGVCARIFSLPVALAVHVPSVICLTLKNSPSTVIKRGGGSAVIPGMAQPLVPRLATANAHGTNRFMNRQLLMTGQLMPAAPPWLLAGHGQPCVAPWAWARSEKGLATWRRGSLKATGLRKSIVALKKDVFSSGSPRQFCHFLKRLTRLCGFVDTCRVGAWVFNCVWQTCFFLA